MQYLYRIQPTRPAMLTEGPTAEETAIVGAHFARLQDLAARGIVILAGRTLNTDESGFGVVIFNADSDEQAEAIMLADPAVRGGVMRATLFPYRVALIREQNV